MLGRLLYIVGRLQLLLGRGALSVACSMRTDERLAFAPGFELGEGFAGFRIRPLGTKICVLDEPPWRVSEPPTDRHFVALAIAAG